MILVRGVAILCCAYLAITCFDVEPLNAAAFGSRAAGDSATFVCRELLGRPTGNSIALNFCADKNLDAYVEYGTQRGVYGSQSPLQSFQGGIPSTITIANLTPNTRYYYRVRYRVGGSGEFLARAEHTFQTARPKGSEFVFAIEADPHMDTSTSPQLFKRTLANILSSNSDFLIDLGDTFMSEKIPSVNQNDVTGRNLLLRSCFDTAGHSVPLMLVQGNHDGELGWLLDGTADNLAIWATNTRKAYYPNPAPDNFYSGDTTNAKFTGVRQNYYAWEWGNALFVVLDVYWYTAKKPGSTKNNWDWTLGKTQYDWFRKTLETSKADFKFVFAHQVVGGSDTEGRGGIEAAPYYEMGGLNGDGTPGFAANRPGWAKPIHQLMVENRVSAFFHGHDHVFVKQDLDGIVYHELPQPGYFNFSSPDKSYSNAGLASKYGYTHGDILSSSGFLRVTVSNTGATVDYVRTYLPEHENSQRKNGEIAYSYTLKKSTTATSVERNSASPDQFDLSQNYPNPFNPETAINYTLTARSFVDLKVYDVLGREVATLVDRYQEAGTYTVTFNSQRYALKSGVYFYRLVAGNTSETRKLLLAK